MKFILFILFSCLLVVNCKNEPDKNSQIITTDNDETRTTLQGAWELISFYNYIDNMVTDSFQTIEGYRQVKMYTPSKVMWSKQVPSDSTEWFGYGNYRIEDNNLIEVLDYGSEMMTRIIEERKEFIYELTLEKNKFSQIEIDENGNRIYSENYKRIE